MNGGQDLGGMMGFGPVVAEPAEPVFHAEWERRVFAMAMAMGFTGKWTLDGSRAARESLPPADYISASYYEIWLRALENQVLEHGLATSREMESGILEQQPKPLPRLLKGEEVFPRFRGGFPSNRPAAEPARFKVGDVVVARNMHPQHHTRLPRYVRGHCGLVQRIHGAFLFPDSNAYGPGGDAQWLYTVAFEASDLWGDSVEAGRVTVAAFESYLLPAGTKP